MNATHLLMKQHQEMLDLCDQIASADELEDRATLFARLESELVAHDVIERELFYPACMRELDLAPVVGEALAAHRVVEFSLYECEQAVGTADFAFKMKALRYMLEHHIDEEQDELFGEVPVEVEALGDRMQTRYEALLATDYREMLHDEVRQAVVGPAKPRKARAPKKGARSTKATFTQPR